ncbi:MJ0307 family thioredoxin [Archaeoglobus neptunius]|uniref:MJ0307 family thioredoxin n=1 Tax=Archaeoglobus neptunius TaxID=2798580 RepID=UPI001927A6CB|nr:MJ0307 family thioredoxin [Archaeoglobus neptunius]
MVMMKLFTSPTCPYCPKAEKVVSKVAKEEGVLAIELPVNTDEGMKEALKYGIRGVPALVINDMYLIVGVPDEGELRSLIRKLKGGDLNEAS